MKIDHIQADNFLRLNLFDADLTDATVHLFAGNNESGKSSVQEAIRFALLGETLRVSKKGDYKLMIRDGAKAGSVSVILDGNRIWRDIKTGKKEGEHAALPEYLPYLLDSQRFAHENHSARRAFLLGLTGTSVLPDDIARRMTAKGVHNGCIEKIKPMLRASMDAAHKESQGRAADLRAQWTGLTGCQRYGARIASDWSPEPPEGYEPQALLDSERYLEEMQGSIDDLNVRKGGLIASLANIKKALDAGPGGEEAPFDQKELEKLEYKIRDREGNLEQLALVRDNMNSRIFNAREMSPVTCCKCGAMLRVEFVSEPGKGRVAHCEPFQPLSEDETHQLNADHDAASIKHADAKKALDAIRNKAEDMRRIKDHAVRDKPQYTQADANEVADEVARVHKEISRLSLNKQDADASVSTHRTAANQVRDAGKIKDRAMAMHRGIKAWGACSDALAPDGIPAEILSDTLKPVNERLRATSTVTGWAQVTIDPTMEIIVEGRRYSLLSESARWRADVSIADAISHLSGLRLLIVDRIDVLDIPNRGALMKWVQMIMPEYDTVLLFGTLKQLPSLPEGMQAHWIESGELREDS